MADPPLAARLRSFLPGFPAQVDAAPPGQPRRRSAPRREQQRSAPLGPDAASDGQVGASSPGGRARHGGFGYHAPFWGFPYPCLTLDTGVSALTNVEASGE